MNTKWSTHTHTNTQHSQIDRNKQTTTAIITIIIIPTDRVAVTTSKGHGTPLQRNSHTNVCVCLCCAYVCLAFAGIKPCCLLLPLIPFYFHILNSLYFFILYSLCSLRYFVAFISFFVNWLNVNGWIGLCAFSMGTHTLGLRCASTCAHTHLKLLTKYIVLNIICERASVCVSVYAVIFMWCQLERNFKLSIVESVLLELLSLEWAPIKINTKHALEIHLCVYNKKEAEEMLLLCVQSIYLNERAQTQWQRLNIKTTHPIPVRSHLITTNRLRFYYECVHIVDDVVVVVGFVYIPFRIVKFTRVLTSNQIESHFSTISVSFGNAINSNVYVCVCTYNLKAFDTSCK